MSQALIAPAGPATAERGGRLPLNKCRWLAPAAMERSIGDSTETGPRAQRHIRAGTRARLFGPAVGPERRIRARVTAAAGPWLPSAPRSEPRIWAISRETTGRAFRVACGSAAGAVGKALPAGRAEPAAERAVDTGRVTDLTVSSAAMTMGAVHGKRPSTAHTPASSVPGGEKGGCFRSEAGGCFRYP